jgi:hypothetical protein
MNRELRMRFLKLLVNVPLRIVDKVLPEPPSAVFPQTKLLLRTYKRMLKVYRRDCEQGYFGPVPDGNFERFLRVSWKVLARLSEDDRYYRAWVGFAFVLAHQEIMNLGFSVKQLKSLIWEQWHFDVDFLPDAYVAANKAEFLEMALANCLSNAVDMQEEDWR